MPRRVLTDQEHVAELDAVGYNSALYGDQVRIDAAAQTQDVPLDVPAGRWLVTVDCKDAWVPATDNAKVRVHVAGADDNGTHGVSVSSWKYGRKVLGIIDHPGGDAAITFRASSGNLDVYGTGRAVIRFEAFQDGTRVLVT